MNWNCGGLVIGHDVAIVVIHGEVQWVESGLVCKEFYEIGSLLQIRPFFVGVDKGAVDVDETISEVIAQALSFVRHEIYYCYADYKP